MAKFDDADFRRAFKELFLGKVELAEQLCAKVELFSSSNSELASEITQVLNIISTAYTLNYSFKESMEAIREGVDLKNLDEAYVVAMMHRWLAYVNSVDSEINTTTVDYPTINDSSVDGWDEYFFNVARQTARNSKCFSRHIGAVIVKDKSIIGTGYNSPPRGVPPCDQRWGIDKSLGDVPASEAKNLLGSCPRKILGYKSGEGIDLCIASHAEESAIVNCARMGISTKGASLYLTCGKSCSKCAVKIINSGIKEVIVTGLQQYDKTAQYLFDNSTVTIRVYDFIK